jgi:hypothetical protein
MAVDEGKLKSAWDKAADDTSELSEDEVKALEDAVKEGRLSAEVFSDDDEGA